MGTVISIFHYYLIVDYASFQTKLSSSRWRVFGRVLYVCGLTRYLSEL